MNYERIALHNNCGDVYTLRTKLFWRLKPRCKVIRVHQRKDVTYPCISNAVIRIIKDVQHETSTVGKFPTLICII